MPVYPKQGEYTLPKKNVLVVSCMDLRLTDNLVDFLQTDNLTNRYDHFILAGASLFTSSQRAYPFKQKYPYRKRWKDTLYDHLQAAINLHGIRDVYIIEHEDCGAYINFLEEGEFDSHDKEKECHCSFAKALATEINKVEHTEKDRSGKIQKYRLVVHCFFINLRGDVELLYTTGATSGQIKGRSRMR